MECGSDKPGPHNKKKGVENQDMIVKARRLGQPSKRVSVDEEATVEDVLDKAGLTLQSGESLFINGDEVELDTEVAGGDQIYIQPNVKLGC